MQLDIDTAMGLIRKAREQNRDERIFQQWVSQLPFMGLTDSFMSFSDYKDRVTGANIDWRPASEINRELDEIEKELQSGGER